MGFKTKILDGISLTEYIIQLLINVFSVRAAPSTPTKLMSHDPGPSVFTPVGSDEEDTLSTMSGHLDTIDTAGTSQINLDTLLQDKLKRVIVLPFDFILKCSFHVFTRSTMKKETSG